MHYERWWQRINDYKSEPEEEADDEEMKEQDPRRHWTYRKVHGKPINQTGQQGRRQVVKQFQRVSLAMEEHDDHWNGNPSRFVKSVPLVR